MLSTLISTIGVLLSIAFFTLMERKLMGLAHFRKGPNKVLLSGLTQPMSDATKLLTKESTKYPTSMTMMMMMGPTLSMVIMFFCWANYNPIFPYGAANFKLFIIIGVMSLSAFPFILCSWGSNSKYALMGGNRAVSQIISYEVCLIIFLLVPFYVLKTYNISSLALMGSLPLAVWVPLLFIIWMMLCLAESNRTPFDTAEGESEIVSGFNIDYSGGLFALIFISEYGMIMFMSYLTALVFLSPGMLTMKTLIVCFIFIWVRCSFPRLRYDMLMMTSWKISLPLSLCLLMMAVNAG